MMSAAEQEQTYNFTVKNWLKKNLKKNEDVIAVDNSHIDKVERVRRLKHHYRDVENNGRRLLKNGLKYANNQMELGQSFSTCADRLGKDSIHNAAMHQAGIAFVGLASLQNEINETIAKYLEVVHRSLAEQQLYQDSKSQYLAFANRLKKDKTQKQEDQCDDLKERFEDELQFMEDFFQTTYMFTVKQTLKKHQTNLDTAQQVLKQTLTSFGNIKSEPKPKRSFTQPDVHEPVHKLYGEDITNDANFKVLNDLIAVIDKHGLEEEGIFRQAGSVQVVNKVKHMYDTGRMNQERLEKMLNNKEINVYGVSTLLKSLLRESPNPVIPFDMYDQMVSIADETDEKVIVEKLKRVYDQLPERNTQILKNITLLLCRVINKEEQNRMNAQSLSIVVSNNLLRSLEENPIKVALSTVKVNKCVEQLIRHSHEVMGIPKIIGKKLIKNTLKSNRSSLDGPLQTKKLPTIQEKVSGKPLPPLPSTPPPVPPKLVITEKNKTIEPDSINRQVDVPPYLLSSMVAQKNRGMGQGNGKPVMRRERSSSWTSSSPKEATKVAHDYIIRKKLSDKQM